MASTPLIIGNWKMNGLLETGITLVKTLQAKIDTPRCEVVLCPPATLLSPLAALLGSAPIALGGQDCHTASDGAYTGNISATMLKDLSCRYVILGHSERRQYHQETNALVRQKAESALNAGLIPIICIGESLAERENGTYLTILKNQLTESLPATATPKNTVIAYEPVWAIGSGKIPSIAEIQEVHETILSTLAAPFRILYGGSVKPINARDILAINAVNGLLIGGCSLHADDFLHIIQSASIEK